MLIVKQLRVYAFRLVIDLYEFIIYIDRRFYLSSVCYEYVLL